MLVTLVEGDPKALFSIAIIPRCRGEGYSIPWIVPLYLDPYLKPGGINTIFWDFFITRTGIEPQYPRLLANTQLIGPMAWLLQIRYFLHKKDCLTLLWQSRYKTNK